MRRKQAPIPQYSLGKTQASNVSIRTLQDADQDRPAYRAAHRDDYYIFLFLQAGKCCLLRDFQEITFNGASVGIILPGQVHQFISSKNVTGWLLAAESSYIDPAYRLIFEENTLQPSPISISETVSLQLNNCIHALYQLLQHDRTDSHQSILFHLISAYAGLICNEYLAQDEGNVQHKSRPAIITGQFRVLLKQFYREGKSPGYYADKLNLSVNYLNESVKATTGMPVSYWIQQEVILEAKRLLGYSELSIKEIAYDLGYEDHTYFSRQFLKVTGTTPARFRQSYHE